MCECVDKLEWVKVSRSEVSCNLCAKMTLVLSIVSSGQVLCLCLCVRMGKVESFFIEFIPCFFLLSFLGV